MSDVLLTARHSHLESARTLHILTQQQQRQLKCRYERKFLDFDVSRTAVGVLLGRFVVVVVIVQSLIAVHASNLRIRTLFFFFLRVNLVCAYSAD